MLYREYASTGKKISIISAGGMRYPDPDDIEGSAEIPLEAARLGINYFDTAPGYCKNLSEKILGTALKKIKSEGLPFYVSTKSGASDYDTFMEHLESSLKKIGVDHIDFMHSWGINRMDIYETRKAGNVFEAMRKAKDEGMIKHIVCSSHMSGADIARMIDFGVFEGITLGFCAINFPFRMEGLKAARKNGVGVITMNPLAGGQIIEHAERFGFIRAKPDQTMLEAALHFNMSHEEITSALVGFSTVDHVRSAVKTLDTFEPLSDEDMERIKGQIEDEFDELCTTCGYCADCPEKIPVPQFIESYNHYLLNGKPQEIINRLKWHWAISDISALDRCTECRKCEDNCTQKLPILERFADIKALFEKKGDGKQDNPVPGRCVNRRMQAEQARRIFDFTPEGILAGAWYRVHYRGRAGRRKRYRRRARL